jgi:hypothetical protein
MFRDLALQVQMTLLKGDGGGLIFGTDGSGSQEYRFAVNSGTYDPRYYDVFLPLEGSRVVKGYSPSIIPGQDQSNLLTVIVQGSVIYLYVNGQYVNQFQAPSRTSVTGSVGVFATNRPDDSTEVVFRDLKVWA